MMQHRITPWVGRFMVVSGLLGCISVLLLLLSGAGALPPAQAQEPDVSASAITQNVSASVNINNYYTFTGTQIVTISRNVAVSLNVTVRCWNPFTINATAGLSGNVPVTIKYAFPLRQVNTSIAMSGSSAASQSLGCPLGGGTFVWPVSFTVPVSGQLTLTTQGSETGAIVEGSGTVSGQATIWVTGSASLVTFTYLPMIARQEQPAGGAWSDDFSEDRGWRRLSSSDVCDVGVEGGTLRVKLKKAGGVCWISAPVGVFLAQGTFQVDAVRTSDKKGWFGLVFNATTSLLKQRWQLDAAPWDGSDECGSGKARVKLSYKDGSAGDQWPICTNALKRNKNEWNTLKVVRSGDNVKAYINGEMKIEVNDGHLKDAGLFDLVVFGTEKDLEIWFDNFSVTP